MDTVEAASLLQDLIGQHQLRRQQDTEDPEGQPQGTFAKAVQCQTNQKGYRDLP